MKAWRLVAGAVLVLLSLWPALPAYAQGPQQVWVDDGYCASCSNDGHTWGIDAFSTISAGARAVASGGTVYVRPGRYRDDLYISRPCSIVAEGSGSAVLAPRMADATITVAANDVTIQGLEVVDSFQAAILIVGPRFQREAIRNVTVQGNVIRGGYSGVAVNVAPPQPTFGLLPTITPDIAANSRTPWEYGLLTGKDVRIANNTISACKRAVYIYNTEAEISGNSVGGLLADGIGIYASQGSVARIKANTVQVDAPNAHGIYILENQGSQIEGNTLVGSTEVLTPTTGLALSGYQNLLISNNSVQGFYSGMAAYTGGSARITRNTFDGALGASLSIGTAITTTNVTIEDNSFRGAYLGLLLADDGEYGLQAAVRGNLFDDNVTGITIDSSVREDQVSIHGNIVYGNIVAGLRNESEATIDAASNWWGANDGPKPYGRGDRAEGVGPILTDPWLRLQATTRVQPDGQVVIKATLGNGRYYLQDQSLTFHTDRGAFVETDSANRTVRTGPSGEAEATLYPLNGSTANVTISSRYGQGMTLSIPSSSAARAQVRTLGLVP